MSEVYLPKELREGLQAARNRDLSKKSRLRLRIGEATFPILRYSDEGFALDAGDAPVLRGLVDVYDGARHVSQCLIVASAEVAGQMVYEFKRATPATDSAPLDYPREDGAPVALIERLV